MKIDYYKKSRMNHTELIHKVRVNQKTDEWRRNESIPGINTKKINEPMWIDFTDKVNEFSSIVSTEKMTESLSIIDTGVMTESVCLILLQDSWMSQRGRYYTCSDRIKKSDRVD